MGWYILAQDGHETLKVENESPYETLKTTCFLMFVLISTIGRPNYSWGERCNRRSSPFFKNY
jgi:hypothetical protein